MSDPARGQGNQSNTFRTQVGLVLSCVGCMVGTGNIWRFPRILANNSGGQGCLQFLMVWVLFLFIWSIPMIILEYGLGRYTKRSTILSFSALIGPRNAWCGAWVALVSVGIGAYYSVVLGWCFYYLILFTYQPMPATYEASLALFEGFAMESSWPVLCHGVSILLAAFSVMWSVKSIEIVNSIIVPFFLTLLFISFVWSMTFKYGSVGLKFMFSPDWGEFGDPRMWVDAISQNAFDTGAATGLFVTYSTFMTADNGVVRYGRLIPIGNNIISLLCGMLMFSTVFSTQIQQGMNQTDIVNNILRDNGPANTGLTFVWIPILYSQIEGGRILIVLFFFALSMAGFSSLVANVEMFVHNVEDLGASRIPATIGCCTVVFLLGLGSALNIHFLENQDFVWGFALLISGLLFLYLVIRYGVKKYRDTFYNNFSTNDWNLGISWQLIIKYLAPLEATFLLVWWMADTIASSTTTHPWYGFSPQSFMATITQWGFWMIFLILVNLFVLRWRHRRSYSFNDERRPLPKSDELMMYDSANESSPPRYSTLDDDSGDP